MAILVHMGLNLQGALKMGFLWVSMDGILRIQTPIGIGPDIACAGM